MRLKVYSTILFCLWALITSAQYSISGHVSTEAGNENIEEAQVVLKELNLICSTDKKGNFKMEDVPAGEYNLVVFSFQYETDQRTLTVDDDTKLDISLKELEQELSEVVIQERKEEIFGMKRLQPVEGTAIYAGKKSEVILLDQMVGNKAGNNARQVFSQVVGLNIYDTNDAGLQLSIGGRGLDPNRSSNFNMRQNGYDISADVLGYPESYYTPPAESLEEIEVVRGAASLQYGTQFGGLVNFKMKSPVEDKKVELISRQSVGSWGMFSSFNSLSGTVGKFSYYTYFHYKRGDGYRPNSEFDSKNYFGDFRWQLAPDTKLSFEYTHMDYLAKQPGGLIDQQFAEDPLFSNRSRNWFHVNWNLYCVTLEHKFSTWTDFSLNVFGLNASRKALGFRGIQGIEGMNRNPVTEPDWLDEEGNYVYTRDLIIGDFSNWGAEARLLSRYTVGGKNMVFLIGSKFYNAHNTSRQGPGSNDVDADFSFDLENNPNYPNVSDFSFPNLNASLFGENVIFVNDQLSVTPGFRFEYIKTESEGVYRNPIDLEETSDNRSLPRKFLLLGIGISNVFSPSMELYGNISQNYRSVTFSDIRTVNPTFIIDPEISDEKGYTADAGLRGRWGDFLSYDVGVFALSYQNRIGVVFDNRANRVRTNIGDALIYGVEFFVDWNLAKTLYMDAKDFRFKWFVNSAFTQSTYLNSIQGNSNIDGNMVEFIPHANIKSGLNFGYKNFLSSLQLTYMSKQYTDAENSPVADPTDARAGVIGEIPAYHIMDFSLSYRYKMFGLETGINNLTDNSYFTRRATGYPGPGIIPSDGRSFYLTLEVRL